MSKIAEYIWIDANGSLRSKARTLQSGNNDPSTLPKWNFDGSSTGQAVGTDSEVILVPVAVYNDPFRGNPHILVLCECYDRDLNPIETNNRYKANEIFKKVQDSYPWYGLEQEYVMYDINTNVPLGWSNDGEPEPQGKYYCGVGAGRVFGRHIVDEHYKKCLQIGINISGVNAEVMPAQWEFQVGPCEGIDSADQTWMARYILEKIGEEYGVKISYEPKPVKGDWNGSGCHINYSTVEMRNPGGKKHIFDAIQKLSERHMDHINVYGDNSQRLTGLHETSRIDEFSYGIADRTASIRIPSVVEEEGCGYLEDRRPASDIDPYLATAKIAETTILYKSG